jgi:hypothetical protein
LGAEPSAAATWRYQVSTILIDFGRLGKDDLPSQMPIVEGKSADEFCKIHDDV